MPIPCLPTLCPPLFLRCYAHAAPTVYSLPKACAYSSPIHVVPHLLVPNLQVSELVKSWATKGAVNKVEFVSFSQDPNPRPLLLPADERVVES